MATKEKAKKKPVVVEIKRISWYDNRFYKIEYTEKIMVKQGKKEVETDMNVTTYFPSVTTKLNALSKPFLARWRGDIGNREADIRLVESQERGSRIHWAWECYSQGGAVIYQHPRVPTYEVDEINEIYKRFNNQVIVLNRQDEMHDIVKLQAFMRIVKPEMLSCEELVYDIETKDAGTADNFMRIAEGEYIINGKKPLKLPEGIYGIDLKTGKVVDKTARMQVAKYCDMKSKGDNVEIIGALILHTQGKTRSGIVGLSTIYITKDELAQELADYEDISRVWMRNFDTMQPTVRELPTLVALPRKASNETNNPI